ncbi:acyl-CoA thioesterase-2 [Bradyrhizobium japonicum]
MAVARGSRLGRVARRGIGDDDGNLGPEPLSQRQGQRKPCKRAATNDNATLYRHTQIPDQILVLLADLRWAKQCGETRAERPIVDHPPRNDGEKAHSMSKSLIDLISILDLEQLEVNLFRGNSPKTSWQRVFGGQVIGQAMVAACRTVEGRLPHSLHCYFVLPGDPQIPIIYQVERLRDGKSYSTRRVTAIQHGNAIFSIMVSFHAEEESAFDHQDKMPDVPPPEKLTAEEVAKQPMFKEMPEFIRRYYESDRPIELRPVELGRYFGQKIDDGRIHVWIKTAAKLPDDPALHMCALAYASDFSLLDAIMARYGRTLFDKRMMPASLDHAMWFHRPFRADEWLLYAQDSPSARGGRGLTRGSIFKPDGTLVASVAQEGSVRERKS